MTKHFNIHVSGKVQGVFYLASTRDQANTIRINGFVRNQQDGSVYIEAEGDDDQVDQLVVWCRSGPPHAKVTNVDVKRSRCCRVCEV